MQKEKRSKRAQHKKFILPAGEALFSDAEVFTIETTHEHIKGFQE
jgi:hypothetical protein